MRNLKIPPEISALPELDWYGEVRGKTPDVQYLPRTEWQCVECAHVNERSAAYCDDCGAPYEKTRESNSGTERG